MKPEGIFKNGDLWYNGFQEEEGKIWYPAYKPNSNFEDGADYETEEIPERFPLFTMVIFPNDTKESECQEYFLAKKIGDSRFGNDCLHSRVKNGFCPDCLRKVSEKRML